MNMMANRDGITVEVKGLENLRAQLAALPDRLRRRVLRNVLAVGARVVRDEAKRLTPVLAVPVRRKGGQIVRKPGTVRQAIKVRTSKEAKAEGNVGVFVNVVPAKAARFKTTTTRVLGLRIKRTQQVRASQRGAQSPVDPYYWRFLEFGTRHLQPRRFLRGAAAKLGVALQRIEAAFAPAIAKINTPK
jgi:HK97 gp10 family phage protein